MIVKMNGWCTDVLLVGKGGGMSSVPGHSARGVALSRGLPTNKHQVFPHGVFQSDSHI